MPAKLVSKYDHDMNCEKEGGGWGRSTYWINVSRKVGGVRPLVVGVIDRWNIGHETQVGFFIWQLIQSELQIRCRNQAN